ncbi:glycosyl hydrolase family 65 protein [Streptomyces sp. NPDC086147]|uniref:glycosyl hydrolase family 65 protein n=1 Tax=Streptomyces sp. NPDC086147 TaxID=3155295 RepID=UPI00344F498E
MVQFVDRNVDGALDPAGRAFGGAAHVQDDGPGGVLPGEPGPEGLRVEPVALAQIPRFAFTICFHGHRGVHVRVLPGRLAVRVPSSSRSPLTVVLPGGRRYRIAAGEERWLRL